MTRLEAGLLTELSLMYALQQKRSWVNFDDCGAGIGSSILGDWTCSTRLDLFKTEVVFPTSDAAGFHFSSRGCWL